MKKSLKEKEFIFTFENGGWNSVWAKTKKGAEKKMKEKYLNPDGTPKNEHLVPRPGSATTLSDKDYQNLLRSFY